MRSLPAAAATTSAAARRIGSAANVRAARVRRATRCSRSVAASGSGSCIGVAAIASRISSTLAKRRLTAGRLTPPGADLVAAQPVPADLTQQLDAGIDHGPVDRRVTRAAGTWRGRAGVRHGSPVALR